MEEKMKSLNVDCIYCKCLTTDYEKDAYHIVSQEYIDCSYHKRKVTTCSDCSAYENNKKHKKLKQVVKEIPKKSENPIVTYRWLVNQGVFRYPLLKFVEEFGKETDYNSLISRLKDLSEQKFKFKQIYLNWMLWLEERKHLLFEDEGIGYITVDKMDFENKLYFATNRNKIFKIDYILYSKKKKTEWRLVSLVDNESFRIKEDILLSNYSSYTYIIYEFDSLDDFVKNYDRLKKIQKEIK